MTRLLNKYKKPLLFVLVPSLQSQTSIMILPSGALTILLAWLRYRKEQKA